MLSRKAIFVTSPPSLNGYTIAPVPPSSSRSFPPTHTDINSTHSTSKSVLLVTSMRNDNAELSLDKEKRTATSTSSHVYFANTPSKPIKRQSSAEITLPQPFLSRSLTANKLTLPQFNLCPYTTMSAKQPSDKFTENIELSVNSKFFIIALLLSIFQTVLL